MKFSGKIGYCETVEGTGEWGQSKWEDVVKEYPYKGDVLKNSSRYSPNSDSVIDELSLNKTISIVADEYAWKNYYKIKYVMWQGQRWKVTNIDPQRPRLILTVGGVYNGPTPAVR